MKIIKKFVIGLPFGATKRMLGLYRPTTIRSKLNLKILISTMSKLAIRKTNNPDWRAPRNFPYRYPIPVVGASPPSPGKADLTTDGEDGVSAERLDVPDPTNIREQLLTGAVIAEKLDELATLRLDIFLEYPYLYQGRREDELAYLRTYAEKPEACVILAYDGHAVIA